MKIVKDTTLSIPWSTYYSKFWYYYL